MGGGGGGRRLLGVRPVEGRGPSRKKNHDFQFSWFSCFGLNFLASFSLTNLRLLICGVFFDPLQPRRAQAEAPLVSFR